MKRFAYCFSLLLLSVNLMAQQEYFIFIQSDQNQPFYVLISTKTYSSTPRGNLIISKLKDSTYKITVGFPGNKYPEQNFTVPINKKDKGFQLRKVSEGEWNLFNWQNQESIKPPQVGGNQMAQGERKTDHFALMMANVVNDSAILYTSIATAEPGMPEKKEELKTDVAATGVNGNNTDATKLSTSTEIEKTGETKEIPKLADTTAKALTKTEAAKTDASKIDGKDASKIDTKGAIAITPVIKKEENKPDLDKQQIQATDSAMVKSADSSAKQLVASNEKPVAAVDSQKLISRDSLVAKNVDTLQSTELIASSIKKVSESTTEEGKELVFVSYGSGPATDTVRLIIPFSKEEEIVAATKTTDTPVHDEKEELKPKTDPALIVSGNEVKKADTISKQNASTATPADEKKKVVQMVNSDCRSFANDSDVDKLRLKMLAENNMDDRIGAARKYFKTKCFYTKQVKSLSELFLSDEGRYRFFDAAYPFVVDTDNYKELASLLNDEYFVNRFKAMVRL